LQDLDEGDEDAEEERNYLRRLEGGLFTLQLVDYILLEVCTGGPSTIKQRVTQILNLRGGSLKTIRHVMRGKVYYFFYIQRTNMVRLYIRKKDRSTY
jgi:beta-catenin-like protein 1